MKKIALFTASIFFACTSLSAQEYAKNSFGINTSGPFPAGGLQWNHQLTEKTTFTAVYGQAQEQEWDAENPYTFDGSSQEYSGTTFQASSWTGFLLNYRPFDNFQGFRVACGMGVGRLGGTIEGLTDNNTYFINGHGPYGYMGIGYGLKPVKGLQWGIDIGWLRAPGFTVESDGTDASTSMYSMELVRQNHLFPYFPNAQITLAWGF